MAVIGGAPSVIAKIQELKDFDGDRWIIASAFPWCRAHEIHGTYFNIDPSDNCIDEIEGVEKAILASCVTTAVFDALIDKGVSRFDLVHTKERLNHGCTTATAVPELALLCGYQEIIFYGCESSFSDVTHAYRDDKEANPMSFDVLCNGETFETRADYLMQAEFLATLIRAFPDTLKEASGGLLRALVADPEFDITHCTRAMYETLNLGDLNAQTHAA